MAFNQYNHQWMPTNQHGDTDATHPPPYTSTAHSASYSYKPSATVETFEVDDSSATDTGTSVPVYRKQTFQQKYLGGLKRTLRFFTSIAVVVLAINIVWLFYAKSHYGIVADADGYRYGTIMKGECSSAKRINTWMHLAINIMSTLLLAGSNAFMSAYSGPTRREVDDAHAKQSWLHIGGISIRNMRGIAKRKTFIVIILGLTSMPFHLLYNSLVFTSLATNNYYWTIVTEGFLNGTSFNLTGPVGPYTNDSGSTVTGFQLSGSLPDDTWLNDANDPTAALTSMYQYFGDMQKSAPGWQRLDQRACIQAYADAFVSTRRNVVLVSSTKNNTNSVLQYSSADLDTELDHNWWLCSMGGQQGGDLKCNPEELLGGAASWTVFDYPIKYCLSETTNDVCTVKFSLDIMIILVAFNALKVLAMTWVLLRIDAEHILTSVGDAVASFIRYPDLTTRGMCLANKRNMNNYWRSPGFARLYEGGTYRRWGHAISKTRWAAFFLIVTAAFCLIFFFGIWGFIHVHDRGVSLRPLSLWKLGFGTISQYTMVIFGGAGNAISMSLLANLPQVILAMIYVVYQGIITAMFNSADWARFAFAPQYLMTSTPSGKQRSVWLLGAPFTYGICLLTLQIMLHWTISQSIFVVQIAVYNKLGTPDQGQPIYSNCGYSPIAIVFAVAASFVMCFVAVVLMFRTFPMGAPPVVSTCTSAISAACHIPAPLWNDSLVYRKLRWGVTDQAPSGIGHCSLGPAEAWDDGRAGPPVNGNAYAGLHEASGKHS